MLVCVVAVAALFFYSREKEKPSTTASRHADRSERQYAGVAIKPGRNACEAAESLRGRKLLVGEAPPLPLSGCTSDHCSCVFRKFDDRRAGEARRWSDVGIDAALYAGDERRAQDDRRNG
ncbi:MAG: hypothetical protein JXB36_05620 [Gammaproteobacteria bacterium]|nr:hypothetical protein [Gammaproteobacteria bacterium]